MMSRIVVILGLHLAVYGPPALLSASEALLDINSIVMGYRRSSPIDFSR